MSYTRRGIVSGIFFNGTKIISSNPLDIQILPVFLYRQLD